MCNLSMGIYEDGITEGNKQGIKIGVKRGRQQGKLEGAKENSRRIVLNMLSMHMPIKDIMKATELTEEEINQLKLKD